MKTTLIVALLGIGGMAYADTTRTFNAKCAPCHGKDGKGDTTEGKKLNVKDLTKSHAKEAEVIKSITEGAKDKDGKESMKGLGGKLTPEQIKELAGYVMSLRK